MSESRTSNDDGGDNEPNSSGQKRRKPSVPSQQSLSFVKPSQSTRQHLLVRDDFRCWLCGVENSAGLEASHNIGAADRDVFQEYKSKGLLPESLTHPAHIDNLILLCALCYKLYDAASPRWFILPENIGFLINWEEEDYKRREERAVREGIVVPRTVPGTGDYSGGFVPHFFDPTAKWMLRPANQTIFPRKYLGAPTTVILKAALAAFQPFTEDKLLGIGLRTDISFKLWTLLSLYTRGNPSCPATEPGTPVPWPPPRAETS